MTDEPTIKEDDRLAGGGVEVERYTCGEGGFEEPDRNGPYVRYEDYAALRQRCEQAERRLNEASHDAIYEAHRREQAERERDEAVGKFRDFARGLRSGEEGRTDYGRGAVNTAVIIADAIDVLCAALSHDAQGAANE